MNRFQREARPLICLLIVATFFLPAYRQLSGFTFVKLALNGPESGSQLTFADTVVAILPLLLIPAVAAMLLVRSLQRVPVRKTYVTLPLVFLIFFSGIVAWSERHSTDIRSLFDIVKHVRPGYYAAVLCCGILPFTRNRKRRRHSRRRQTEVTTDATV